jgi:hypothetical protein
MFTAIDAQRSRVATLSTAAGVALIAFVGTGCGHSRPQASIASGRAESNDKAEPRDAERPSTGERPNAQRTGARTCVGSRLTAFDSSPGVLSRILVDLPLGAPGENQRSAPFLLDTGSPRTYIREGSGNGADVPMNQRIHPLASPIPTMISCINAAIANAGPYFISKAPDQRVLGGVIGTDLLTVGGVLDLRIRDSLFVWSGSLASPPRGAISLPVSFDQAISPGGRGFLVASHVKIDGREVRLLVDTGSPNVVLLSKTPRPGEKQVAAIDGTGASVTFYESTTTITFNDAVSRTVVLDRAAEFPTVEHLFKTIAGDEIAGILGLGALGHDRFVISKTSLTFIP